jgi:hypothetical protein
MNPPAANEYSDDQDDRVYFIYEEADLDVEEPLAGEGTTELESGQPKTTFQPSEQSIVCYGTPEDDVSIEFLDRRYALENEITLENGEKVTLQLTDEQKLERQVIRNLAEARHNRKLFSQRKT